MSIKDRMEVGQMWKDTGGNTHKIKWVGCTGFVGKTMAGGEYFWRFEGAENWKLTHFSDGTTVCEEEDKPPGVLKIDVAFREYGIDDSDTIFYDFGAPHKDYIGWEDDAGNLHGFFRITGTVHTVTCISAEQMETGAWERVPIKRLWFEDGVR